MWSVMFHAHKKTSLWRSTRKKGERGWVTILHPGWSAPTCGKTQYLHFAIRTTFFSLYFPEHRLHTSLLRGMPQWDCWALMACTCLSATECKHREKPLDMLLRLLFVSESAATAAFPSVFFFFFLEYILNLNEIDINPLMQVAATWHGQVCA